MSNQVKSEALSALELIHGGSQAFEIRILVPSTDPKWPRPTIWSGVFNDTTEAYDEIVNFRQSWSACYFTINCTTLDVTGKISRKTKDIVCTSDSDVVARNWLWIDIDPIRYEGDVWVDSKRPSSKEELSIAEDTAKSVARFMQNRGMPEPVLACSGNGWHLLWKCVDGYSVSDLSYRRMLVEVASRFNSPRIDIDLTIDSPGQLCKLYGSLARKGESSESRAFRFSKIVSIPRDLIPVTVDTVSKAFSGARPRTVSKWIKKGQKEESQITWTDDVEHISIPKRDSLPSDFTTNEDFDAVKKVTEWGYQLGRPIEKGEYKFHPFKTCACERKLTDESSGLYVRKDGAVAYRCFHASCDYSCGDKENKWGLLRSRHETNVKEKREPIALKIEKYSVQQLNKEFGLEDDPDEDFFDSPKPSTAPDAVVGLKSAGFLDDLDAIESIDEIDDDDPFGIPYVKDDDISEITNMLLPISKKKAAVDDPSGLGDDLADSMSDDDGEISVSKKPRSTKVIRAKDGRRVVDTKSDPADIYQHVVDEISQLPDVFINGGRLAHVNVSHGSIIEMVRGYLDRVTFQS